MITKVGVVGCGLMGSGIAEVSARKDLMVVVVESDVLAVEQGMRRVDNSLSRALKAKKITEEQLESARSKITYDTDMGSLFDCDIVIEAIVESESAKEEVFRTLDKVVVKDNAILASNTSSIPIMKLAMATSRPETVVGIHFFNPVPVLPLVEIVRSLLTSPDTEERATDFVEKMLSKHVIRSKDRAGFIVNALLIPYILSAIRMFESGDRKSVV